MKKIEHLGIAVANLEEANEVFRKLLGKSNYKTETVQSEGVMTSFFELGDSKIELLQAQHPGSVIAKYLEKGGRGIHHIAIAVVNIEEEMIRLRKEGFQLLSDVPLKGADNKLICFLHPKSTCGVLVELCQDIQSSEK